MKTRNYFQIYVKRYSNIGFVTVFNLLISGGIIYEIIVFKRTICNFINSYFFQVIAVCYGLNQNCYALGDRIMCLLNHLGRNFESSTASNLNLTTQLNFCPRRAFYRIECRKYPLLIQCICQNTLGTFRVMQ